jgi:hypothetical protein
MVCEALSGYACNMDMYTAEGRKLEDTVLSLLDRNLGQNHHIYLRNLYECESSWNIARQKVRVCGTMRANRCIPRELERQASQLKKKAGSVMEEGWRHGPNRGRRKDLCNGKHETWRNVREHRNKRQRNKPVNKETLPCCPMQ